MKLRFLTSCSTDGPSFSAGRTYELEAEFAAGFIRAGLAVPAETEPAALEKAPAPVVETATAASPVVETAAAPKPRRGRN